jgi:iron complex outermembrane receptor protein
MKLVSLVLFLLLPVLKCTGQIISDSVIQKTYSLGEVLVSASADRVSISSEEIRKFHTYNAGKSVEMIPSVTLSSFASRNESTIFIHGFDTRSIPVFIDGIPVYVPYDGYVDLSRFTTFDVSRIDVSKGFSPMSYGANTAGGVINLVSLKPADKFELEARTGIMSGKGYLASINAGSNTGKFWFQSGFSATGKKFFPLAASFDTTTYQKDHRRDNSGSEDLKFSFRTGYMPAKGDEYSVNYIFSHGSKGTPVYLGNDENTRVRFWKWPYWDKQSIYYISRTTLGQNCVLKARAYFDQFKNKLSSFDDQSYTTQNKKSSSDSFYNDNTFGGNAELSTNLSTENHLIFSAHVKNDNHRESSIAGPVNRFSDNTFTAGIDDSQKSGNWSIFTGLSYNSRLSLRNQIYNSDSRSFTDFPGNRSHSVNAQAAAKYSFSKAADINFSLAWKSRFATMKDRYSYRLGTGIPNPGLKPEKALNLEMSSTILPGKNLQLKPEVFLSRLYNTIQLVSNVQDGLSQMKNTGNSIFSGLDLTIRYDALSFLRFYGTYSFIRMKNLSNHELHFTNVPRNRILFTAELNIENKLNLNLVSEYRTGSYSASDGSRYSPGFFLLNSNMSWQISELVKAEAGIGNILDRNYSLEEGYPEPGRNLYFSLVLTIDRKGME